MALKHLVFYHKMFTMFIVLMYLGERTEAAWYNSTIPFIRYAQYVSRLSGTSARAARTARSGPAWPSAHARTIHAVAAPQPSRCSPANRARETRLAGCSVGETST